MDSLLPRNRVVMNDVLEILKNETSSIINIKGASGTGKSVLLSYLSKHLQAHNYSIITLRGDRTKKDIDFYPIDKALIKISQNSKLQKKIAVKLFEEIPVIGKPVGYWLDSINSDEFLYLDIPSISDTMEYHKFSLHIRSLLSEDTPLLILCDDIQYFDEKTIKYLNDTIIKFKNDNFPNINFITTINTNSSIYNESYLNYPHIDFTLSLPRKSEINEIMMFWGLSEPISRNILDIVYTVTNGHLYLLHTITERLKVNNQTDMESLLESDIVLRMVDDRLLNIGSNLQEAKDVLYAFSHIGSQALKTEISCVLNNPYHFRTILRDLSESNLLFETDDYVFFRHDIIQRALHKKDKNNLIEFNAKLSQCIKNITPSNYNRRSILKRYANENQQADILITLYACQKMRNGQFSEARVIIEQLSSELNITLKEYILNLTEIYQLSFSGRITEAQERVESINNVYPYPLNIEISYLLCVLNFKSNNSEKIRESLELLNSLIDPIEDDEFEIWSRCMMLKQVLESELLLTKQAKLTQQKLQDKLSKRLLFDREAKLQLDTLILYSDTIYPPHIAHKKLLELTFRLQQEVNNGNYESLFNLYIAASNLSGNAFIIGKYQLAVQSAHIAQEIVKKFRYIHFPYHEVWQNNLYLSKYYMGHGNQDLISKYEKLLSVSNDEDRILIFSNYLGLLMDIGNYQQALELVENFTFTQTNIDSYYLYYYQFNYSLILYFNGYHKKSIDKLKEIQTLIPNVSQINMQYYSEHHKTILDLLCNREFKSIKDLQVTFEKKKTTYLSSLWERFKQVYLFSDLQVWTQF